MTDFFWSSHEHCWRWDFTCSLQKHCKNIEINSCNVFFPITGGILVSFIFFILVKKFSDMESKENTIFGKNHIFRIFQNNPLKLFILKFPISRLFSINIRKKHFFGFFHGLCLFAACQQCSALNQRCSEMFINESVMTSDVKIKVGWFSSEHRWKRKNLWISAENDWISMRAQPGYKPTTILQKFS